LTPSCSVAFAYVLLGNGQTRKGNARTYVQFDDRMSVMHDDIAAKVKKACGLETAMKQ